MNNIQQLFDFFVLLKLCNRKARQLIFALGFMNTRITNNRRAIPSIYSNRFGAKNKN
jgi:hypothetical protein